jgi:hypothetical protein
MASNKMVDNRTGEVNNIRKAAIRQSSGYLK